MLSNKNNMDFLTNLFGKGKKADAAVGSKVKSPTGTMVTVKQTKLGEKYITYKKDGKLVKKVLRKATSRPTHKVHSKLSPKRKGVMSDNALRKLAKKHGISVYSLSKRKNKRTGTPVKSKKLVSRSTLLKRLREAGVYLSPNRRRRVVEPDSDDDSVQLQDNDDIDLDQSDVDAADLFPDEDDITMVFGKKKKRKANPDAVKAMRLVYSKGISLKEAWAIVKGKKGKGKDKGTKSQSKKVKVGSKIKSPTGRMATVKMSKSGKLYINYTKDGKKSKKYLK